MWFDSSLATFSLWITYCVQVALAYLTMVCICAFIQNPRARVRMWGCFLFLTITAWLLLCAPTQALGPVRFAFHSVSLPPTSNLRVALPVTSARASYLARLTTAAWVVYVSGLLASLLRLLFKSMRRRAVLRRRQQPSSQLQLLFVRLCGELGISRSELSLVSELRSPGTCYWLRSHVLLPTELVPQLDSDQLADVLRHELIHVRQHDYLWDQLAALACRLVFFHPLMWLAYRQLRWEQELACDYRVVEERKEARLPYAECLTRLARRFGEESRASEGIGFSSSKSLLAIRVRALLTEPSSYSAFHKAARGALVAIVTTVALLSVPRLGLTLYSPVPLAALLIRSRHLPNHSTAKKRLSSPAKAMTAKSPWKPLQSEPPLPVNLFLDSHSTSLPVLQNSSTEGTSTAEAGSTHSDRSNDSARLHASGRAWDESPMPLASPPKWRRLAVGAITGGVALATGRVDVDDVDGPRKRDR
jgi:beta-lactamase regulating signal transducer with metallopeptidase domain